MDFVSVHLKAAKYLKSLKSICQEILEPADLKFHSNSNSYTKRQIRFCPLTQVFIKESLQLYRTRK